MASYNGHRSWNAWNVSLWINNDEGLYRQAVDLVQRYGLKGATQRLYRDLGETRTPDGAVYNVTCIREALRGVV